MLHCIVMLPVYWCNFAVDDLGPCVERTGLSTFELGGTVTYDYPPCVCSVRLTGNYIDDVIFVNNDESRVALSK